MSEKELDPGPGGEATEPRGLASAPPRGASPPGSATEFEHLLGRKLGIFTLVRLLGRGGMGAVFEARDESLDRLVAVKVILPELARTPRITARFLREAKVLSRLSHPNAVSMFAFGEEAGILYMVLELVTGCDLASLIASEGPFPLARATDLVTQALGALGAAHALGIIHRDLKPGNVMVGRVPGDQSEHVKVLDFGLAKRLGDRSSITLTGRGGAVGTLAYMAPEQVAGKPVDPRADLYAVGVVLYEMLTGELPFDSFMAHDLMRKKVFHDPPAIRLLRPDLPASVEEVVTRALAREPSARYRSARLLADALAEAAHGAAPAGTTTLVRTRTRRHFLRASVTAVTHRAETRETPRAADARSGLELGRYRLERLLTRARTGEVYEAVDRELDRPVLLKVHEAGPEALTRLLGEARLLAKLGAPHAPEVIEVGEMQGIAFLAILGFPGRLLSNLAAETPHFPPNRAAACALQLLAALERLHGLGKVHRDIHPENVLVTLREEGETFQLLGFELASDPALAGVPPAPFASPEQTAGGALDARSDLYSVAAVVWQLVRGKEARVLPVLLGAVVERGVASRPDERFPDAQSLAAAIEAARAPTSGEEPLPAASLVGQRLGRYRVESLLGKGLLGAVYRGLQVDLRRPVAIRVLAPELASRREAVRELVRGVRAVARLSHPSIAQVFEVGVMGSFVASELVGGTRLRELVAAGPLPVAQACGIAVRLLSALGHAHTHGVVHGRLDASSVVLTGRTETPRIVDFGLEPLRRAADVSRSEPDAAADLVAVGKLLHEMLTGKPAEPLPRSPRRERPEITVDLESVVLKALSPRDTERFADARTFGLALRGAIAT